jgi:type IV pilus modification protein PilV
MRTKSQSGFTLLESLIAVVLIGLAFLATAGLHISSFRDTQLSTQTVAAAELVHEMNERMRLMSPAFVPSLIGTTAGTTEATCLSGGCKPADMAKDELKKWQDAVAARLPGGGGIVCFDSSAGKASPGSPNCTGLATDPILVKVWWQVKKEGAADYYQFSLPYTARL